jgi:hypothetical protein
MLNKTRQTMGYTRIINLQLNGIPSAATNMKKITKVSPKFMSEDTFFDNKNRYLGTLTFVKILLLVTNELIPLFVASRK